MNGINFGSNYLKEMRALLSRLNGGMVRGSAHPDIFIPNGSPEYRKTTLSQTVRTKLGNLKSRFSRNHTKSGDLVHQN